MSDVRDLTTEKELDAALERAKTAPERPEALSARYDRELDLVEIRLNNGRRIIIPREELQELEKATPEELADIEIFAGVNIGWRQLNVDHYLPHLLSARFASEKWKAAHQGHPIAA